MKNNYDMQTLEGEEGQCHTDTTLMLGLMETSKALWQIRKMVAPASAKENLKCHTYIPCVYHIL